MATLLSSRSELYLNAAITGTGLEGLPAPMSRIETQLYFLAQKIVEMDRRLEELEEHAILDSAYETTGV